MSLDFDFQFDGLNTVKAMLDFGSRSRKGMEEVGDIVEREARNNAPISPKQGQWKKGVRSSLATRKVLKATRGRKSAPGTLERSITHVVYGGGFAVRVFTDQTSKDYAGIIHDERGTSWKNLGAGSLAKKARGHKVGEKFVTRGYTEHRDDALEKVRRAVIEGTI
jgi:hypothetical protein